MQGARRIYMTVILAKLSLSEATAGDEIQVVAWRVQQLLSQVYEIS